jgi:hypothetical protein
MFGILGYNEIGLKKISKKQLKMQIQLYMEK